MEVRGVGNKQIAALIGVSEGQVSHKVRMTSRSKFNVDELGLVGQHWEKEYGAPHGWPFLDWAYARAIRDANTERDQLRGELDELRRRIAERPR
jgi:hypothetical protein